MFAGHLPPKGAGPGEPIPPGSAGLPQLDPIALRIGDPAKPTDTFHVLSLLGHVRSLGAQLRKHRIQVADTEVEHGLLGAGAKVLGLGLEHREHCHPGFLTPQAVLIGVQPQAIAIPRPQGHRVGGPHEVSANAKHTFHVAILPGPQSLEPQLPRDRSFRSSSDLKRSSILSKLSSAPSDVVMWSRPALSRNASLFVSFVTPSVSCRSVDSTACASGHPSNSHVWTVRAGGSTSR